MHGSSLFACLFSADGAPRVPSERLFESLRSAGSDDSVLKGTREFPLLHSKPELFIKNAGYLHLRMLVMFSLSYELRDVLSFKLSLGCSSERWLLV